MEPHSVAKYVHDLRLAIEQHGTAAFERDDWAKRFWEFGFEMDCGRSYEERYGLALDDAEGLRRELARINDMQALGNAAFSQCRYITHWSEGSCEREVGWLVVALARLEELGGVV